jgi:hypothetical protein
LIRASSGLGLERGLPATSCRRESVRVDSVTTSHSVTKAYAESVKDGSRASREWVREVVYNIWQLGRPNRLRRPWGGQQEQERLPHTPTCEISRRTCKQDRWSSKAASPRSERVDNTQKCRFLDAGQPPLSDSVCGAVRRCTRRPDGRATPSHTGAQDSR